MMKIEITQNAFTWILMYFDWLNPKANNMNWLFAIQEYG